MTNDKITATDATALPKNPDIDRAALILFDGKSRERFDFTRDAATSGTVSPDIKQPVRGIIHRAMAAIWPDTDMTKAGGTQTAQPEPVGELLNPNVVKLVEGEFYDIRSSQTYRAGDQMDAAVWLRNFMDLPPATADDAPVGYQLGDSAPLKRRGFERIAINSYDDKGEATGAVIIYPNGDTFDNLPHINAPDDMAHAVDAVLRRLHGVTTRSPSEAHAIAGATQLDEALNGSTEGISQTILAAAAEAADLEPVSEPGYDETAIRSVEELFDMLTDEWASNGIPDSMAMKLRELLADETPDPAVMSDVLFVIDADGGNARAIITEDGIRLEGGGARAHNLLGEATGIRPLILERETNRKLYAATTLADASKAIRYAIESGEDVDAAGELIEDLWNWLNDDPAPIKVKPWSEMSEGERAWAKSMAADVTQPGFFAASGDFQPLTDETRDRIKAAIDSEVTMADIRQAKADIEGKDFDHEAADAFLRECCGSTETYDMAAATLSQARLDRIRGEAASATAGIVDRMENRPEGKGYHYDSAKLDEISYLRYVLTGENAQEVGKAMARAATVGTAWLHLTSAHAEGVTVKLVTPQDIDPDFADMPITREPQDSDAPDGIEAETVHPADSAYITARTLAKRHGAAIIEHRGNDRFTVASPVHFKIGYVGDYADRGRAFFAKPRSKPKT